MDIFRGSRFYCVARLFSFGPLRRFLVQDGSAGFGPNRLVTTFMKNPG